MAGQIDFIVSDALPAAEHIKSGKLRALAITSGSRTPLVPGVPTFSEGGLPGFVALTWWGVFYQPELQRIFKRSTTHHS